MKAVVVSSLFKSGHEVSCEQARDTFQVASSMSVANLGAKLVFCTFHSSQGSAVPILLPYLITISVLSLVLHPGELQQVGGTKASLENRHLAC